MGDERWNRAAKVSPLVALPGLPASGGKTCVQITQRSKHAAVFVGGELASIEEAAAAARALLDSHAAAVDPSGQQSDVFTARAIEPANS